MRFDDRMFEPFTHFLELYHRNMIFTVYICCWITPFTPVVSKKIAYKFEMGLFYHLLLLYLISFVTVCFFTASFSTGSSSEVGREILVQHLLVKEDDLQLLVDLQKRISEGKVLYSLIYKKKKL